MFNKQSYFLVSLQIHTRIHPSRVPYGNGNFGLQGFANFFMNHECNEVCSALKLNPINRKEIDSLYGTKPNYSAIGQWTEFKLTSIMVSHQQNRVLKTELPILRSLETNILIVISPGLTEGHTFVSYFQVFQMSAIPRIFGLQLWNLGFYM